ncbi:NIPSNAP family containing protein [Segetibacter sp. 3557_3]|uniref:NIPSNAP family protein n=1 Tax=Segetibacter sp. 3557_3 TaxID=2547429 RepID=UPI00105910AA|nr:NIPSNAP family protein [Segetibacter sp. 3557_3]TDH24248.1 NIPSNAP family containing protein [Segetibacter sp. 3557_3]
MKNATYLLLLLLSFMVNPADVSAKKKSPEFYQVTVYHFTSGEQERQLDNYLKDAYLPALHRLGSAHVGVFKPIANDTAVDKLIYVIAPFKKADQLFSLGDRLQKDAAFTSSTQSFDTSYRKPPFSRMENMVLRAFSLAPAMKLPKLTGPRSERVYELRSYEGATERFYRNKVQMFNQGGEIDIFSRLDFNPVFYAEVIAGSRMPNLMYMTSFENRADRDAHWKSFSADEQWKKLSAMPEYQHNVSRSEIKFLRPTEYSDY